PPQFLDLDRGLAHQIVSAKTRSAARNHAAPDTRITSSELTDTASCRPGDGPSRSAQRMPSIRPAAGFKLYTHFQACGTSELLNATGLMKSQAWSRNPSTYRTSR